MDPGRLNYILESLAAHATLADLKASSFYAEAGAEIDHELGLPRVLHCPEARPHFSRFLRIAQWNIEKGVRFEQVLECLCSDSVLRNADVLLLNEVDFGMCRSGNRDVTLELAQVLRMHSVFGAAHFELTKGTGEDLLSPGENRGSRQGNAVLSRHPILDAKVIALPRCFEPFEFHEKRYGSRSCVWARLALGAGSLWVGSTHLEVRNTPACRARQVRYLMANLPGRKIDRYVFGGDFNSNGFARGTTWRTLLSVLRLVSARPDRMRVALRHPDQGREPLFRRLRRAGFEWEHFNSSDATADAPIERLEDAGFLPSFAVSFIKRRLDPYGGYLPFKLDWLAARGFEAAAKGALRDSSGEYSMGAGVIPTQRRGPERLSDHSPIFADIAL